jgi:hypothetical protein
MVSSLKGFETLYPEYLKDEETKHRKIRIQMDRKNQEQVF